jgi:hypothetical protein
MSTAPAPRHRAKSSIFEIPEVYLAVAVIVAGLMLGAVIAW